MIATTISAAAPSAIEAAVMRRVTWRILPFLMLCYFVSFLDKVNTGFAALQMNRDLHLSHAVFGLGGGLFFVSYFLFEVPSNLALARVGARRWIARIMITWGIIAGSMALVRDANSFYLVRGLLGAAEAGFFPGVVLYLTFWFPAAYRARIIGFFMVAIPVSACVGSPLSAALLGVDGWLGLAGWQWLYIIEGVPAVVLGLLCLVALTDRPAEARWLAPEQRDWLAARLATEAEQRRPVPPQPLWRVLTNGRVLGLAVVLAGSTAVSSGLQLWTPLILKSFGLGIMATGLANAVPFGIAALAMVLWGRDSDRRRERVWHAALPLVLAAFSLAAALVFHGLVATMMILSLALVGIYAGKGPVWAISTEWLAAGAAAAGLAQINALSNLAGFGTIYGIGLIRDATGDYSWALLPLAALALMAAGVMWRLGRTAPTR
jgi:sugar phosphate permease